MRCAALYHALDLYSAVVVRQVPDWREYALFQVYRVASVPEHSLVVVRFYKHEPAALKCGIDLGSDVSNVCADCADLAVVGGYPVAAALYRVVRSAEAAQLVSRAGDGLAYHVDDRRIRRYLVRVAEPLERSLCAVNRYARVLGEHFQSADVVAVLVSYKDRLYCRERYVVHLESRGKTLEAYSAVDEKASLFRADECGISLA